MSEFLELEAFFLFSSSVAQHSASALKVLVEWVGGSGDVRGNRQAVPVILPAGLGGFPGSQRVGPPVC